VKGDIRTETGKGVRADAANEDKGRLKLKETIVERSKRSHSIFEPCSCIGSTVPMRDKKKRRKEGKNGEGEDGDEEKKEGEGGKRRKGES